MQRIVPLAPVKKSYTTLVLVLIAHSAVIGLSLLSLAQVANNFEDHGTDEGVINGFIVDDPTPAKQTNIVESSLIDDSLNSQDLEETKKELERTNQEAEQAKKEAIARAEQLALEEQQAQLKAEQARLKAEQQAKELAEKQAAEQARLLEVQRLKEAEQARLKAEQEAKELAEKQAAEAAEKARLLKEQRLKEAEQARLKAEQEAKEQKSKQQALEAQKAKQLALDKKKAEEKAKQLAAARKAEQDKKKAEQAATTVDDLFGGTPRQGSDNSQVQENNLINKYISQVRNKIMSNFNIEPDFLGKQCLISININTDGTLKNSKVISGDQKLCNAALRAIKLTNKVTSPDPSIAKRISNVAIEFKPN